MAIAVLLVLLPAAVAMAVSIDTRREVLDLRRALRITIVELGHVRKEVAEAVKERE